MKRQSRATAVGILFRVFAGVVLVYDGVLLYAIIRAAAGGFRPLAHAAVTVSGVLMLGLATYLLVRAPHERTTRGLAAFLLLAFPAVVFTASMLLPRLVYRAGLSDVVVRLARVGGRAAEPVLTFLMRDAPVYLAVLAPFALVYFAVFFPRPLTALDVSEPTTGDGALRRVWRPIGTRLASLRRLLLLRPLLVAVGVLPPVLHMLEPRVNPILCTVAAVALMPLALSYLRDGYLVSAPGERRRILWVMGGLFVGGIALSTWTLGVGILDAWTPLIVQQGLYWLVWLTVPVAAGLIAAGVLYRGAFDPGLVIRRTSVYGALGALLTMTFAVVEEITAERVFEQAGLPDKMGAALAALVVVAVFRPVRDRLGALYDSFLGHGASDVETGETVSVLTARADEAEAQTGIEGLSATVLLHRCARRIAAEEGGRVHTAEDEVVALLFPEPARAVDACVVLRSRLEMTAEVLGAGEIQPRFAVYHPEPGEEAGLDRAVEAAHRLVGIAEPGEVVLSAGIAAEPGVIRTRRLEPAGRRAGPPDLFRLADDETPRPTTASAMTAAVPVLAGIVLVAAAPVLMLADRPEPATAASEVRVALAEAGDSLFEVGRQLTREQAIALEAGLGTDPADLTARGLLLRYWCGHPRLTIPRWRGFEHAIWILAYRIEHPIARHAASCLPREGPAYDEARRIMLAHVNAPEPTPRQLGIAGYLLRMDAKERERAGRLLARATEADSSDPLLWHMRGMYFWFEADQPDSAAAAFATEARLLPRRERGIPLVRTLHLANRAGLLHEYRGRAVELGCIARDFSSDTSVSAAHLHNFAESAFGLLALEAGDREGAVEHLMASMSPPPGAESPPYAQLALAAALWDDGQHAAVVQYLKWAVGIAEAESWKDRVSGYLRRARGGENPGFSVLDRRL